MNVELLSITPNSEELIERACRICYNSECNPETRDSFISGIIKRGHESVIEHASATFEITGVSRALTHQLVRCRLASYSQKSQRYCKEGQFDYVIPPSIQGLDAAYFNTTMRNLQKVYNDLIQLGIKAEDARFVLPNACCTEIVMTMNFRELRHFIELRADKHAQWEIRELAKQILDILFLHAPNIFKDLKEKFDEQK